MNKVHGIKTSDLQKVVDRLKVELRYIITNTELKQTFTAVLGVQAPNGIIPIVRKMIDVEREATMQALCDQIGKRFEYPPKPKDLIVTLETAGYKFSRPFQSALLAMIHAQNSDRWEARPVADLRVRPKLTQGEMAMWEALSRSYNMDAGALASTLLRIFAVATMTRKIDFLEVPFLASSINDEELKRYAKSLNFTVKKTRKSRV
jgi:hypothetical protein